MIRRILIALILLVSALTCAEDSVGMFPSPEVENSVATEDWAAVAEMMKKIGPDSASPVSKLIKGHACLALNRNNESISLFASALDESSLKQWQTWTDNFVKKHEGSAAAWYLRGDAFARQREWNTAESCFDRALRVDAECCLAWNARGVVAHAAGNTIMARSYFQKAVKIREDFADAYASRGVLNVNQCSARGAADCFGSAVQHSHDTQCDLFEIGLGCSSYGLNRYDEAKQVFNAVPENSPLWPLAKHNSFAAEIAALQQTINNTNSTGMALESVLMDGPMGQLALLQGKDSMGDISYSLILQNGSQIPLDPSRIKVSLQDSADGAVSDNSFYDGEEPEVHEGDGYRFVIFKKNGRIYRVVIEVMVNGTWKRVSLSSEAYQRILELLRQGKKITLNVKKVEGLTVVVIYADGEAVWEIHYGPDGRPVWQGPPGQKQDSSPDVKSKSQGINSDILELETIDDLSDLIAGIIFVRKYVEKEITNRQRIDTTIDPTRKANLPVGGVDSSDIRRIRANHDQWPVTTVYGLLYPISKANTSD